MSDDFGDQFAEVFQLLKYSDDAAERVDLLSQFIEHCRHAPEFVLQHAPHDTLMRTLRVCYVDSDKAVRQLVIRVLRYLIVDASIRALFAKFNFDVFVSRSLERDSKFHLERIQALKLVRKIIEVDATQLSRLLCSSLIAISQQPDDDYREACVITLRELVLLNPDIVFQCGGIRVLFDCICDSDLSEIAPALTMSMIALLDAPDTRRLLRPRQELRVLFSAFTDIDSADDQSDARCSAAQNALLLLLRSWPGLLCLMSDPHAVRSIIGLLALPDRVKGATVARDSVFEFLFRLLDLIKPAQGKGASIATISGFADATVLKEPNVLLTYMAFLLVALINCGLVEMLVKLSLNTADEAGATQATKLLCDFLIVAADLLPDSHNSRIHRLSEAILIAVGASSAVSTRLARTRNRLQSSALLSQLAFTMAHAKRPHLPVTPSQPTNSARHSAMSVLQQTGIFSDLPHSSIIASAAFARRRRRASVCGVQADMLTIQCDPLLNASGTNQEDVASLLREQLPRPNESATTKWLSSNLQSVASDVMTSDDMEKQLSQTNVLNTKDTAQWNLQLCFDLINGAMVHQSYLAVALRTRFFTRIFGAVSPLKSESFSIIDQQWTPSSFKMIRVAVAACNLLVQNDAGCAFEPFKDFIEHVCQLFRSFVDLRVQDQAARFNLSDNSESRHYVSLSRDALHERLSREYTLIIGALSHHVRGRSMIASLWQPLGQLVHTAPTEYLIRSLLPHLNYHDVDADQARGLLAHCLAHGSLSLRRFIVSWLRLFLRQSLHHCCTDADSVSGFKQRWTSSQQAAAQLWALELLVSQLHTPLSKMSSVARSSCLPCASFPDADRDLVSIAMSAVSVLDELVHCSESAIRSLVALRPSFAAVPLSAAKPLLLRLLTQPCGVEYLADIGFLLPELKVFLDNGFRQYDMDQRLSIAFAGAAASSSKDKMHSHTSHRLPPHMQCAEDDHYWRRVHALPWVAELTVELSNGREQTLLADTFVETVPLSVLQARMGCDTNVDDQLVTLVTAHVINTKGSATSVFLEPGASVHASIRIASDSLAVNTKQRTVLASATNIDTVVRRGDTMDADSVDEESVLQCTIAAPDRSRVCIGDRHSLWHFECLPESQTHSWLTLTQLVSDLEDQLRLAAQHRAQEKRSASIWNFTGSDGMQAPTIPPPPPPPPRKIEPVSRARVDSDFGVEVSASGSAVDHTAPRQSVAAPIVQSNQVMLTALSSVSFVVPCEFTAPPNVSLSPHLLGLLASTTTGCQILQQSNCVDHLVSLLDTVDCSAAIWALGAIGSSDSGAQLLRFNCDLTILKRIVHFAQHADTLSVRGTAVYALGSISRTCIGRLALDQLGWESPRHTDLGISVPRQLDAFFDVPVDDEDVVANTAFATLGVSTFASDSKCNSPASLSPRTLAKAIDTVTHGHFDAKTHGVSVLAAPPDELPPLDQLLTLSTSVDDAVSEASAAEAPLLSLPNLIPILDQDGKVVDVRAGDPVVSNEELCASQTIKSRVTHRRNDSIASTSMHAQKIVSAMQSRVGDREHSIRSDQVDSARATLLEGMVLGYVSNLSNHVTQKSSHSALVSLKQRHPDVFRSARVYLETCRLLALYTFRLPARRFVLFELFDELTLAPDDLHKWFDAPLLPTA